MSKPAAKRDQVFKKKGKASDFAFNKEVATVFDDMVSRSVPFYGEMHRMVNEIARDYVKPNTNLYDIGCSTATTMLALDPAVDPTVKFIGIDNSPEMIEEAKAKAKKAGTQRKFEFICNDLHKDIAIENASVITMLLTLQFVRPLHREQIVRRLYKGLNEGGCLLMIEKITSDNTTFNRLFIDYYYDYKRRMGYSELEISAKREALENVLIPYRVEENIELLREAGFKQTEVFFRWYNFCCIMAVK